MTTLSPELAVIDGIPRVSSLEIAEHFQKLHKDVLRKIHQLAKDCESKFIERNFTLNNYSDDIGRELPMYQLSRDGFTLLAMGFTGKAALAWKIRYIEAFNAMEKALADKAHPKVLPKGKPKRLPIPMPEALSASTTAMEHNREFNALFAELSRHIGAAFDTERRIYALSQNGLKPALKPYGSPRHNFAVTVHQTNQELWYSLGRMLGALKASTRIMLTAGKI